MFILSNRQICTPLKNKDDITSAILAPSFYCSVVVGLVHYLDSSSGVVRMWVRIPAWPVAALVSLSKTLNHNCFVLRMGRKAVGPVCSVMHVKEPRTLIVKEKGLVPVFLDSCIEHPAGWYVRTTNLIFCIIIIMQSYPNQMLNLTPDRLWCTTPLQP